MTYVCKQNQHVLISHYLYSEQDTEGSIFITWRQRISRTAKPVGTGYFLQVQYVNNKDGLIQKALERFRHSKKKEDKKQTKMIKETKTQQEVITQHKYCDVCGVEIEHSLACTNATCSYCRKDLCENCIGYEEETGGDYRDVWCKSCWQIGSAYRPMIEALEAKVHRLYQEWQDKCRK